jgi:hypothetical protein
MRTFLFCLTMLLIATLSAEAPFFRARPQNPYHLSIGAVLFDQTGRIACHHFKELLGHKDVYILMRESMENDETIFATLHRGLKEEFGAAARPVAFLGGLSGIIPESRLSFEKTTLYIACQVTEWNPAGRDPNDPEGNSILEWMDPQELIEIMQDQGRRFQRVDANESEMIQRALTTIQQTLSGSL